ncbi:PD-(D/E)XK nuclease family protein [Paenibacillus harenae]|nr:PD-(D/E)XK nuclease family protein [Paenibacillus harenae]
MTTGGRSVTMVAGRQVKQLYEWLGSNPLERKILLAQSHAEGHRLTERVVRDYGAVLHTEIRTLTSWVLQLTELSLAQLRIRYISREEAYWVIHKLLVQASVAGEAYLRGISITPGVVRAFAEAVVELREAGLQARDIRPSHFESKAKGDCMQRLLDRYEQYLIEHQVSDFAGLLPIVRKLPKRHELIVTDPIDAWPVVHREMLECLGDPNRLCMVDRAPGWLDGDRPLPMASVAFRHAVGPLAEVRSVFRMMAQKRMAWDQTEIIVSDDEAYTGAIYSMSRMYGVNCTFSGGLPISYCQTGKAAESYLGWLESNFNVDFVVKALKRQVISLGSDEEQRIKNSSFIRELEGAAIGWGRERYRLAAKLVKAYAERSSEMDEADERLASMRESEAIWRHFDTFFGRLFEGLPDRQQISPVALLAEMITFVDRYAAIRDAGDREALSGMKGMLASMQRVSGQQGELPLHLAISFVRDVLSGIRISVTPLQEPGAVHVTSLSDGGQSGRQHTFIVGMTEKCWALSNRQHPILLDVERARISGGLPTSNQRTELRFAERSSRLGSITGNCYCSYGSYDTAGNTEHYPAFELVQLYRLNSADREADYETVYRHLGEPERYFGSASEPCSLDGTDAMLAHLVAPNGQIREGGEALLRLYPNLAGGARAASARQEELTLSEFDGMINTGCEAIAADIDSKPHLSASRLELFARCPLQYFYHEILGVRAISAPAFNRSQWLDPMQKGNLLHAIYNRYLEAASAQGLAEELMTPKHDRLLLERLTEEALREYAELIPAPSASVYRKECESIRQDTEIFFASERGRTSMPIWFELPLHDMGDPLEVELAEGLSVPVKGYIDRVDQIGPHQYKIYDYKTGNPKRFKEADYFAGGTQVQLALYSIAAQQLLRHSGLDKEASVVTSSYYFPTVRGLGEEAIREQNDSRKEQLSALISSVIEAIGQGVFPPTDNPEHCKWCDYRAVCGDHAVRFREKRTYESNADHLRSITEVNGHG